jgi:hypothetical protein
MYVQMIHKHVSLSRPRVLIYFCMIHAAILGSAWQLEKYASPIGPMSLSIRLGGQKRPAWCMSGAPASHPLPLPHATVDPAGNDDVDDKVMWKRLYHGTWSRTELADRFSPADMSKQDFGELLEHLFQNMTTAHAAKRRKQNRLLKVAVFEEKHADLTEHYHFPMLAEWHWSAKPLAKLLRQHGIFVSFSIEHDYYWSTIVYLAVPSDMPDGKREEDIDPKPWLGADHPSIRQVLEDMPRGARQSEKSRTRRYLGDSHADRGQKDVALNDKQFNAKIIKKGLRDLTAVLAWVQLRSEEVHHMTTDERMEFVGMEAYALRNQADLARRVAFAWDMHEAPRKIALQEQTPWEAVLAAQKWKCTCSGKWVPHTEDLLAKHVAQTPAHLSEEAPHSLTLRQALRCCLQEGSKKFTNVFIYGPKTSGKSHVAKAVGKIFPGRVFVRPVGTNNFPLQKIFGKKVCVLQDIRVDTFKLSFDSLLVWWEGETVTVPLPQNRHDGDREYKEAAPVVATSGDKLRIPTAEALRLQLDPVKQNSMMDDRWRYFHFPHTFKKHEVVEVQPCACCCAKWLSDDSPTLTATTASSLSGSSSHPLPNGPPVLAAPPQGSTAAFVALLERLQSLHVSGGLSNEEFTAAKRKLLQLG